MVLLSESVSQMARDGREQILNVVLFVEMLVMCKDVHV